MSEWWSIKFIDDDYRMSLFYVFVTNFVGNNLVVNYVFMVVLIDFF